MLDEHGQEHARHEGANPLQEKPQQRKRWNRFAALTLILGCLILLGGGGLLIWQITGHTTASSSTGNTAATGPVKSDATQAPGCGPRLPWDFITQETANQLHLTVAQIKAQVLAGKNIQTIAAAQGITQDQLHTIEVQVLRAAYDKFVSMGCYTQQEADAGFHQDSGESPAELNADFTRYFANATA